MNRIASELLMIAKELTAMEFPTQDALDKYLKDHPDANRSNHKVKKTPAKAPSKKVENWQEAPFGDYMDEVGSKVKTTQAQMDYIGDCQDQGVTPEECAKSIKDGSWKQSL